MSLSENDPNVRNDNLECFDIIVQSNSDVLTNLKRLICKIEPNITSLDVEALYPSIYHLQAVIAIRCFSKGCDYEGNRTSFMTDSFLTIQDTAFSKHCDNTINIIAKQIKGIAMGACDSPYDANLTLLYWEFKNIIKIS